ncbi:MAG: elongation factor P maturation arginine rhamnosyltransferase EarP [Gammaproteobacteria bacterium]|nr:elongation factor P maturation arginine rhamnosyltransferase EarP [Gammaproteobacteria bacterium]MBU2057180.1 elongation factor P maturation arginine rhamnosyltransferase EarP [Gammaproteobacteria bacterium]MBU2174969.1 elongation factor P maturation arginine rhamnosyltransferase EarP [Gammaproteobacteria bacterium]MBU2246268.1 elongation factor P maturation arginine rhamnosyltransferase EarP [Gammaproteobacteria bacterium]MBU2346151.1 elongation factor P maturation arginine rhamnosyltransfe
MRCDLFCSVVDNFGDIGICWRLARQLHNEHQWQVTLWVDDLNSFQKICHSVNPQLASQLQNNVLVRHWAAVLPELTAADRPDLVIEALACTIPPAYLQWMASFTDKPLWLNLEYLSAEDWVHGCHALPSPHPQLPLQKYFFFPGFTPQTGGLLREQGLVVLLAELSQSDELQHEFWCGLGLLDAMQYQQKISLFAYSQAQIRPWLEQLADAAETTLLLVPQGQLATDLTQLFSELKTGRLDKKSLSIRILDFMPQPMYDKLLASCDINFVRGEDSVIRAHWAGKPFIWQIYRQEDQAHLIKLQAFLDKYLQDAPAEKNACIKNLHMAWNLEQDISAEFAMFKEFSEQIQMHNKKWQEYLIQQQDLASNLVRFAENKLIMSRNFS